MYDKSLCRETNLSTICDSTWDSLVITNIIPKSVARSISANYNTQNGSLPPNSRTDLFKYFPAMAPIIDPTLEEPVKDTPSTLWTIYSSWSCAEKILIN